MGVLAPSLRMLERTARPAIDANGISGAHVCRITFKHLPQPLRSHIQSFITLGQLFKIPPCPPKYVIVRGVGGSPNVFFIGILIFL